MEHNEGDLVNISYTIRTEPISLIEGKKLRLELDKALKEPDLYEDIELDSADNVENVPFDKQSISGN